MVRLSVRFLDNKSIVVKRHISDKGGSINDLKKAYLRVSAAAITGPIVLQGVGDGHGVVAVVRCGARDPSRCT